MTLRQLFHGDALWEAAADAQRGNTTRRREGRPSSLHLKVKYSLIFIYVTDPLAKYLLRETYWSSKNNGIIICGELILRREDWEHVPLNHNVNPNETDLKTVILT